MQIQINSIGIVHSPFKQKFAIPRQPGLAPSAKGSIEILPPYDQLSAFKGLQDFSHLWISFVFHQTMDKEWSPSVRPPRLGGNETVGVFASRSTFRPNPLGLSVVKLEGIRQEAQKLFIDISGIDLLDETPIIDIKPYIAYSDSIVDAKSGFAPTEPDSQFKVNFSPSINRQMAELKSRYPHLRDLIIEVLSQDPRPAYKKRKKDEKIYAMTLYDQNIKFRVDEEEIIVTEIVSVDTESNSIKQSKR